MARSHFYEAIIDEEGNFLDNIEVSVIDTGTSSLATIYTGKTGGTLKSNPFVTTAAEAEFFAEPGGYRLDFTDTELPVRKADYSIYWSAISGEDEGVTLAQLPASSAGSEGQLLEIDSSGVADWSTGFGDNSGQVLVVEKSGYIQSDHLDVIFDETAPFSFTGGADRITLGSDFFSTLFDGVEGAPVYFRWEPSLYTRPNRNTRWRLIGSALSNAVSPGGGANVNMGIHEITDTSDSADQVKLTHSSSASIEVAVDLLNGGQDSTIQTASAPGSAGYFMPTIWSTGTEPADNHAALINVALYVYWTIA